MLTITNAEDQESVLNRKHIGNS